MGRLTGKAALVTGIGSGMGKACALTFAREGAQVFGCDIDPATAAETISEAAAEGLVLHSLHPVDLTRPDDVRRYVDAAVQELGRIDVLVNAAAINPPFQPFEIMDYETTWGATLRGEADIVFLTTQACWPALKQNGGAIINFASLAAHRGARFAGMTAHCAGKAAVLAMTRQLAIEGAPHGIRANTISPGLIVTLSTRSVGLTEGEPRKQLEASIPLGRLGQPEDVAWCAVHLASDQAAWVTGADYPVDGGAMAG